MMRRLPTKLAGPVVIAPTVHGDERGFFLESYRRDLLAELGVADEFVQDNHSRSSRGIVRGMHFQPGQAKLVRCVRGAIFDVVVDIRPGSPQFGQWEGFRLDDAEHHQLYCPDGFAHGFCVLCETRPTWPTRSPRTTTPSARAGSRSTTPMSGSSGPVASRARRLANATGPPPTLAECVASLPFAYADA